MKRGEVWWAELESPVGSEPGGVRPVVVVQAVMFDASRIQAVMAVSITTNRLRGDAPGNVRVPRGTAGLSAESVASVSRVVTLDKDVLTRRMGVMPSGVMAEMDAGLRLVLDL